MFKFSLTGNCEDDTLECTFAGGCGCGWHYKASNVHHRATLRPIEIPPNTTSEDLLGIGMILLH